MVRRNTMDEIGLALGRHLAPGDTVLLHSDLSLLGLPEGMAGSQGKKTFMEALFSLLMEVLGPQGTLAAPAFTYSYARSGLPFDQQNSPSEVCMFSEFLRTRPQSVRSLHPLFSLTALGERAEQICGESGPSAYGYGSPMHRLCQARGKILFLGALPWDTMTFIHHIEHMAGVPYFYHKAFDYPVISRGRRVKGPFFAFVRHPGGVVYRHRPFLDYLLERKVMEHTALTRGGIWCAGAARVMEAGFHYLRENPFGLIERKFLGPDLTGIPAETRYDQGDEEQ